MEKKQQAAPEFTTDAKGRQLVHVALANTTERATLYAEDYQRLMDAGFSPFWTLTSTGGRFRYVLVNARSPSNSRRTLTVARWIAEAGKGQRVSYADGDRLNLRLENLELLEGPAKAAAHRLRPNDGTPPRKKPKPQTPDVHTAHTWPAPAPQTPAAAQEAAKSTAQISVAPSNEQCSALCPPGPFNDHAQPRSQSIGGLALRGGTTA